MSVKELVDTKINVPIPADEVPKIRPANMVNLMDALRKSPSPEKPAPKKPSGREKSLPYKGIGLVKAPAKTTARRRSA